MDKSRYACPVSKAFTRDDDGAPEPPLRRPGLEVPVPNFVTADGLRALRAELERGTSEERARLLAEHLATAQTVEPDDRDVVGFGATVTVEDEAGKRSRYRIVGVIEAAPKQGAISWQSPVARSLLDARVGDTVELPRGEVTVVAIDYAEPTAPTG
jgi:transcription elongation factor GreB